MHFIIFRTTLSFSAYVRYAECFADFTALGFIEHDLLHLADDIVV